MTLSRHAIIRYWQRVRPSLEIEAAERELRALLEMAGELLEQRPGWAGGDHEEGDRYLELSDGIAAIVKPDGAITTVLTRGSAHPSVRKAKNERKARKRRARKGPRLNLSGGRVEEPKEIWR